MDEVSFILSPPQPPIPPSSIGESPSREEAASEEEDSIPPPLTFSSSDTNNNVYILGFGLVSAGASCFMISFLHWVIFLLSRIPSHT